MISTSAPIGSPAGTSRHSRLRKLARSTLTAGAVGCALAVMAGTAQAASVPIPPAAPNLAWQLSHPFCANCTAAFGNIEWIDPAGTLSPGTREQLQLQGRTKGQPAAGATVFLSASLIGRGAMAEVEGVQLDAAPQAFQLNGDGRIVVTYQTADAQPGPIGTDVITAADNANGKHKVTASYDYDQPASYTLSPVPVAPAGSLAAGQSAPAQLVAFDVAGNVVGGALVGDWDDNGVCGTWWPQGPHHHGPPVGSQSDPTYAFTNAAGQVAFLFTADGSTGNTSVLNVAGAAPVESGPPAMTSYEC